MSDTRRSARESERTSVARHGRLKRPSVVGSIFKYLGVSLAVLVVSAVSIAAIGVWDLSRQVKTVEIPGHEELGTIPEIGAIDGGVNLLLIGSDSRFNSKYTYGDDEGSELNDVNILLHISQDHTHAVAVSFPRDTYVPIPSCPDGDGGENDAMSSQKINNALYYGGGSQKMGLACAVLTVENLTGLSIPFAAEISFDGVIEMSNAVGGVPVCIASHLQDEYTELDLEAGYHELQGMDALKFLRTRHGTESGSDITRIGSQQAFLSSLLRKVKSNETLTDVSKLYGLARAAVGNMIFSESLNSVDTMVQIAKALAPIDLNNIVFVQYPTVDVTGGLEPNEYAADILMTALANDEPLVLTTDPDEVTSGVVADPNAAQPDVPAPDESAVPDPNATTTPPVTELPSNVMGQTAAQQTCTIGRTLDDQ